MKIAPTVQTILAMKGLNEATKARRGAGCEALCIYRPIHKHWLRSHVVLLVVISIIVYFPHLLLGVVFSVLSLDMHGCAASTSFYLYFLYTCIRTFCISEGCACVCVCVCVFRSACACSCMRHRHRSLQYLRQHLFNSTNRIAVYI